MGDKGTSLILYNIDAFQVPVNKTSIFGADR